MIVTIDGPSGVGKSTVTKELAARLGFEYLNTGAMYRAVALAVLRLGIRPSEETAVTAALPEVRVEVPPGSILLNGENVTTAIRAPEVSRGASEVAVHRAVRLMLVAAQRAAATGHDMICDGRDQGSFVFPTADCKFFLVADARVRAERRAAELAAKGDVVSVEDVMRDQEERDRRDALRELAPMAPAPDAMVLDTTRLTTNEVINRLENVVRDLRTCPRR
ncbi:Cytidylate kinase [Gemmata sp. SH-PL17]|uniref:(d)CMP kinase n=1 Tax=Gemmata sp. SH-PL17 TaxID=1630693 RepID=UPI00078C727A|nr:(d)CMP kinase [Gemmata sp. SH-PL17]AMV26618.1 Cytidylate kinase [Gemmata sp. SH-PL17]